VSYDCNTCSKPFASKNALQNHLRDVPSHVF
jgi:hypothetical protein